MKTKNLIYNARIYTQAENMIVPSMAVYKNKIVAVGNNLEYDPDFKNYHHTDLKKRTVIPGLVDAHTHFFFFALSLGRVELDGLDSIDKCLNKIKTFSKKLKKNEWVVGEGYSPDRFVKRIEPDRYMLDKVTGNQPAFIYSKDQHTAWVNSKALKMAGITSKTKQPDGGRIEFDSNGEPTGILREGPAYNKVYDLLPKPSKTKIHSLYKKRLNTLIVMVLPGCILLTHRMALLIFPNWLKKENLV